MTLQRKIGFWLGALAAFAAFVMLFRDVLLPFAAGLVLAYLLNPIVDRLGLLGMGRMAATLLIVGVLLALFILMLVIAAPLLVGQILAFLERAPSYLTRLQGLIAEQGEPLLQRIGGEKVLADLRASLGDVSSQAARWAGGLLSSVWSGGQAVLGIISLLVVTPVVAFYLLLDWPRMIDTLDSWIPVAQRETVRGLAQEMDAAVSGFLRGQTLVCLILGGVYAAGLLLIGLNFAILIGVTAGLISFIPYVGSLLGLLVATGVAVAQFWPDWTAPALVLGVFAVGQFIEGYVLQPKLVGESVGLHPVWLMFALIAAGSLFGFLGLLLAVPLAAIIGVLTRFALRQYLASPLHGGGASMADHGGA